MARRHLIAVSSAVVAAGIFGFAGAAFAADTTPPGPVTGLTATPLSSSSIQLNWTNPGNTDLAGVYICRNQGAVAPTLPCGGVKVAKPTHMLTDTHQLIPNTQYTYSVFALDTSGNAAAGVHASATTQQVPSTPLPGSVTGVTATPLSATSIKVDWTNPADVNFAGVYVCRSFGATAPTMPCGGVQIAKPTHTYTDATAVPSTQYTYAVFAVNASGGAASPGTATATTPAQPTPPAPGNVTGLTATPLAGGQSMKLDWTNPGNADFAGVYICRNVGATAPTLPCGGVKVAKPGATFTDTFQLVPGTQYTYTVFAVNTSGVASSGTSVTKSTLTA